MVRIHSMVLVGTLVVAGLTSAPPGVGAKVKGSEFIGPTGNMGLYVEASYRMPGIDFPAGASSPGCFPIPMNHPFLGYPTIYQCQYGCPPVACGVLCPPLGPGCVFPRFAPPGLTTSITTSVSGSTMGNDATMHVFYPNVGLFLLECNVQPPGNAGLGAMTPGVSSLLHDKIQLQITRFPNPGQDSIRISIAGFARHYNPHVAPNGGLSTLRVAVYPDSAGAIHETTPIAFGDMRFQGVSTTVFRGIFSSADFFPPTTIGDSVEVATVSGLHKTVLVPNASLAAVVASVDPDGLDGTLGVDPASGSGPALAIEAVGANPVTGNDLTVAITLPSASPVRIDLVDASGRVLRSRSIAAPAIGRQVVRLNSTRGLPPGIMFLRVTQGDRSVSDRVAYLR